MMKKEFDKIELPAIQIDYIMITDIVKPDLTNADVWPEQPQASSIDDQPAEFNFDPYLIKNVF